MSLSNRVSVDTDVLFVRNMFVFSTNTNNVPVSTNFIMAIGSNGQMAATDTLYNLSTYGVGYLPSTLSTINGEIVSIGNVVLAGGVIPAQLFSVQTALQSSISSTQGSVDTLSSYVLLNVIPSTVSTFTSYVSSLNSSFESYVAGTSVTPVQLASTYTAANAYTNGQVSTLSTAIGDQICTLSNYFNASTATAAQFTSLSTNVSVQSNYFSLQMYVLQGNFNALSTSTRLLNESNSTLVGEFENDVSSLYGDLSSFISSVSSEVQYLSSITTNPYTTLGLLSTSATNDWPFYSNIKVSSIDVRAAGTAAAPAISFTSGGDTDTGFFHPGDGNIAITTNSTERYRFAGTEFGGSNTEARVSLDYTGRASIELGTFCNDNFYAPTILMSNANTGVAFQTWCTADIDTPGYGATNQLITIAYPSGTIGMAMASTGSVGIGDVAEPPFALKVYGGIRQTAPYIWSYGPNSVTGNAFGTLTNWTNCNLPGPISPNPLVGNTSFIVPFDGVYTVSITYSSISSEERFVTIYVKNVTSGFDFCYTKQQFNSPDTSLGGFYQVSAFNKFDNYFTQGDELQVIVEIQFPCSALALYWSIQYWG